MITVIILLIMLCGVYIPILVPLITAIVESIWGFGFISTIYKRIKEDKEFDE